MGMLMNRHKNRYSRTQGGAPAEEVANAAPAGPPLTIPRGFPHAAALAAGGFTTLRQFLDAEEAPMAEVRSTRRYYRLKLLAARELGETGLESAWLEKLNGEPGTALPLVDGEPFPAADLLATADPPYSFIEDLDGADVNELTKIEGIGKKTAERILAALPTGE